jgi:hypothetical protein
MNYLKIVSKGWAGYSGNLGSLIFKDGVSTEPVSQLIGDRLAAVAQMIWVDADGNEIGPTGVAHRLATESKGRAPVTAALARQSDTEKSREQAFDAVRSEQAPTRFYTREELEEVGDKHGMKGLRAIADKWGVKERSMTALMNELLKVQAEFLEKRNLKLQQHSEKTAAAIKEAEEEKKRLAEETRKAQEEADRLAGILEGTDAIASVYTSGELIIPAAAIIESAWKRSLMTVTGFNALDKVKRDEKIVAELEELAALHGAPLVAQSIEKTEAPTSKPELIVDGVIHADKLVADKIVPATINAGLIRSSDGKMQVDLTNKSIAIDAETLLGSSVLASTYEIGGETVQLGDIVAAAHVTFGGTVAEWNALADDDREALLRLELDKRLAAAE